MLHGCRIGHFPVTQKLQIVLLASAFLLQAETPVGLWKTVDDRTGKPRGIVRIYEESGKYFGKVEGSLDPAEANEICNKCTDDRKNKPVTGMVIMRSVKKAGEEYSGGDILDPDTGVVYRCKFRVLEHGAKLEVRAYFGVSALGRTQIWTRMP
jgi:uncharacterized protein (DUF2147 family)